MVKQELIKNCMESINESNQVVKNTMKNKYLDPMVRKCILTQMKNQIKQSKDLIKLVSKI